MRLLILLLFTTSAWAQFTAFPDLPVAEQSITSKGNLLTNDGTDQVEFPACADTEIIEWDATQPSGFKCVAKPTYTPPAANVQISSSSALFSTSSASYVSVTNLSVTITTTGGPVVLTLIPDGTGFPAGWSCNGGLNTCSQAFFRGGSALAEFQAGKISNEFAPISDFSHVDAVGAGTHTYTFRVRADSATSITVSRAKLVAYELK